MKPKNGADGGQSGLNASDMMTRYLPGRGAASAAPGAVARERIVLSSHGTGAHTNRAKVYKFLLSGFAD